MLGACKEPFKPDVIAQYKNLLIVEGFINIGGETLVSLSRTVDLQEGRSFIPERDAQVIVEGEKGTKLSGTSDRNGKCRLSTQNLNLSERYKLKIVTDGKIYETTFLENKKSPEIDSLNFRVEGTGFKIYANTHDSSNQTRYYNWDFTETWEIRSPFSSTSEDKNGKILPRDPSVNIQYCWGESRSSSILLASTQLLSENKLTMVPVNFVRGNSVKVAYLYSILVRQYGLSKAAYQYLENMKKNTEQIGTIFDPQPSELKGNIVCISDPKEQVIGYISAGTVTQKRLFISYKAKPQNGALSDWSFFQQCVPFITSQDSVFYYLNRRNLIISEERNDLIRYVMAKDECIDCRLRGSNVRPSYWPY